MGAARGKGWSTLAGLLAQVELWTGLGLVRRRLDRLLPIGVIETNPANDSCWIAGDERAGLDILGDDRARGGHDVVANSDAGRTITFAASHTLLPMWTGRNVYPCRAMGSTGSENRWFWE